MIILYHNDRNKPIITVDLGIKENTSTIDDNQRWYCDADIITLISNSVDFVRNNLKEEEVEAFTDDMKTIEAIRHTLVLNNDNTPTGYVEACVRYVKINFNIYDTVKKFAIKWRLNVSNDIVEM